MKYNGRILAVLVFMSALFLLMIGYLTYFALAEADRIVASSYNRRQWEQEESVTRGQIFDRRGIKLAYSEASSEGQKRVYPYKNLYAHVIGYNSRVYGRSQLELKYNEYLIGARALSEVFNIRASMTDGEKKGADIRLTIDHALQKKASELLGSRNGAIVAIRPKTGEVLALVSKPDFDPNSEQLAENWKGLVDAEDSPFLPRATQGLYNPGSTFKPVIACAAVESGMEERIFSDEGKTKIGGKEFKNQNSTAYGDINLKTALAVSSNVVFATAASMLGERKLRDICERFGVNREIPFDIPLSASKMEYKTMEKTDIASVGIGQGKLLVTPMEMALIAAAIGNGGTMMKPYLVDTVSIPSGFRLIENRPSMLCQAVSPDVAAKVRDMMVECVKSGTGKNAAIPGISIAGKTGTAQNERSIENSSKTHAWFIAFAPAENPEIAVSVVIEYHGKAGGTSCAPIARELIRQWLSR